MNALNFTYSVLPFYDIRGEMILRIDSIDGLALPTFASTREWRINISDENRDRDSIQRGRIKVQMVPPLDTSGFVITVKLVSDQQDSVTLDPIILSMVGSLSNVKYYNVDVRTKPKTQIEKYGHGPHDNPIENVIEHLWENATKPKNSRGESPLPADSPIVIDLDTITGVIHAPEPDPPDSIEEAEIQLWKLEKTPNESGAVEYLRNGESWYLRYPNDRKFRVILNPNPEDPDSRALKVTDSLRVGEPGELREEVVVGIRDSTQLELAEQHSKTIRRIRQIRSYIVYLTATQIKLFRDAGIEVIEKAFPSPNMNRSSDSVSDPQGSVGTGSNSTLSRALDQNPIEDIHFEGFDTWQLGFVDG